MSKKQPIIMHIDMNSYFAAVEQQANPWLRGKPVGVCAYLSPRGTIIASSREAKARGIKTGCRVDKARSLDYRVELIENEPSKYRTVTSRVFGIFADYTDTLEPYSIDEAFLDLTGWAESWQAAEETAYQIQERIKNEVGEWLTCSVGISWTRWLAKFAGDTAPKAGVLMITPGNLEDNLRKPLTEAWGISDRMAARLAALDIKNLLELKRADGIRLKQALGRAGYYLWANVNGLAVEPVHDGPVPPKSFGHSYCLPKQTTDKLYLSRILYKLCEKTGRRLRQSGREAYRVSFYLGYIKGGGLGKSFKLKEPLLTTDEIFNEPSKWLAAWRLSREVRMMGVSVTLLSLISGQARLFDNRNKKIELSRALDELNDKYGEYTVFPGNMWGTGDQAKDRIGFRKTVWHNKNRQD